MPSKRQLRPICKRCGIRPKRPGKNTLCEQCHGTCRECGEAAIAYTDGSFAAYCYRCRAKSITTPVPKDRVVDPNCECGKPRGGAGYRACADCRRTYQREYKRKDLDGERAKQRAYRAANPVKLDAKHHRKQLARYGLTPEQYQGMLTAQGGVCAICGMNKTAAGRRLHVDHCHNGGGVRGLLCTNCNTALGHARDNPTTLRAMADYLETHQQEEAA